MTTQEEKINLLNVFIFGLQKYRSNAKEAYMKEEGEHSILGLTNKQMGDLWPWVFGDKCPLPLLQRIVDRGSVTGQEFYNAMFILFRFMPEVKTSIEHVYHVTFPEPDTQMVLEDL